MTAGTETQSAEGAASQSFALVRTPLDLRMRSVVLAERTWQTDTYVRVRVTGEDLAGFQFCASSVADPVIPGEVARGLRRTDDVVGGDADVGQGQLDIDDLRSQ